MSSTARWRRSSRGARMSMVKRASPGITLTAPGSTSSRPTVATSSSSLRARASTTRIISAAGGERVAAQRHRHRAGMAGDAAHRASKRVAPLIAVTTPTASSPPRAPGPARYAVRRRRRRCARAASHRLGLAAELVSASRIVTPSASFWSSAARANKPAKAREPVMRGGKAHALLVAEGDDLDRDVEPLAALVSSSTTLSAASAPRLPS